MLQNGRWFTQDARTKYEAAYLCFRSGWNRFAEMALQASVRRWPCRPKQHYTEHLIYDWPGVNPRFFHNYLPEDYVRRIKQIAAGSHPAYLSKHVTLKYSLQMCLRWRCKNTDGATTIISWRVQLTCLLFCRCLYEVAFLFRKGHRVLVCFLPRSEGSRLFLG